MITNSPPRHRGTEPFSCAGKTLCLGGGKIYKIVFFSYYLELIDILRCRSFRDRAEGSLLHCLSFRERVSGSILHHLAFRERVRRSLLHHLSFRGRVSGSLLHHLTVRERVSGSILHVTGGQTLCEVLKTVSKFRM